MLDFLRQAWSREAVGYRRGELEDGDAVATMVVTLIGGPAVAVGALLVTDGNLDMGQVLLVAPLGALLGAVLVGSSAAMSAQTGANGTWLMRPAFGRSGSVVVSLFRLVMVGMWAVVGLQLAGSWAASSSEDLGMALPAPAGVGVVAALGLLLVLLGMVRTVKTLIRKPLFVASVFLVAVLAWQLAEGSGAVTGARTGSFWAGVQLTVEAAVVFLPFVEALGRRLYDDEVAMTSFGVGYAVPATLMFAAGAFLAWRLGGLEDLGGISAGAAGVLVVVAWVVIAEVDQAFSGFVGAGAEVIGIVKVGPAWVVGVITVAAITAVAAIGPQMPVDLAWLATAVVFPAAVISVFDFHLANEHHYTEADIYGDTEGVVNVPGVACWVVAVLVGQLFEPIGPEQWVSVVPVTAVTGTDLPWRLIVALVAATIYFLIVRWGSSRRSAVYQVRGVSAYGPQDGA